MTHEAFRSRWDDHETVATVLPHLRRYTRSLPVDPHACPYDGIAELYFVSVAACRAAFHTAAGSVSERGRRPAVASGPIEAYASGRAPGRRVMLCSHNPND
jgi:hypothetical protein